MVSSSVGGPKEVFCKRWISVGFGEEVGREVVETKGRRWSNDFSVELCVYSEGLDDIDVCKKLAPTCIYLQL